MGVTFDYYVPGFVDVAEIRRIHDAAGDSFPGFTGFSPGNFVRGYFNPASLPSLGSFRDLEITDITTWGTIKKHNNPLQKLQDILTQGEVSIGNCGLISVGWEFKEKGSAEMKRCNDGFRVEIRDGKRMFGFHGNGSRVCIDKVYAKGLMAKLKTVLDLPIDIAEVGDAFYLKHSLGDELRITRSGIFEENPGAFLCEMKETSAAGFVDMMKKAYHEIGTEKQHRYHWGAGTGAIRDAALSKEIYDRVHGYQFPADKYDLHVEFSLQRLEDVEHLRPLCGPKDKVFTEICYFDLPDINYANVQVITSQAGHRLVFELKLPEDVKLIQERLGVKLNKSYFGD